MKALVLAGGKGTRLRPFTYSGPKQLVPIANVPVLHYVVRQLVRAGIVDIGVIVGDTEEQIRESLGGGQAFGARITYLHQPAPLGLAHAVLTARDFLGEDLFLMVLGDNLLLEELGPFATEFATTGRPAVILKEVPDPRQFGVAEVDGNRLLRVVEKPAVPPTNLAVIGIYALTPAVFGVIQHQRPSARGELEITDAFNGLIASGIEVEARTTDAYWIDTGKTADLLSANRAVLDARHSPLVALAGVPSVAGDVFVADDAIVVESVLRGPVVIGPGARIVRSRIGPYVAVGAHAVVEHSSVENSILMDHATVASCAGLSASIVGRHAVLRGLGPGNRVELGDHSRVEGTE